MDTTSVLPPSPHGGGVHEQKEDIKLAFYEGEFVVMRSSRISREDIKRFYDLYNSHVSIDIWWNYLSRARSKQVEFAKDIEDETGYYMFYTKYIGKVKGPVKNPSLPNQTDYSDGMYNVEWESRDGELMPGEMVTREQRHYPENVISLSKMTVMTKEEILEEVIRWWNSSRLNSNCGI